MKTLLISLMVIILFPLNLISYPHDTPKTCKVTYLANEGFLLETANRKIIIDGIFGGIKGSWCDQPGDSVSNLMLNGKFPFNNIDVVLITHKHSDHFNTSMVTTFLMTNRKSVLICPDQVNQLLKTNPDYSKVAGRIQALKTPIPFDTLLIINKVNIKVLRLNHGAFIETDSTTGRKYDLHSGVENFGYLTDIDGFTFLHVGDGSPSTNKELYKGYGLDNKDLDIAFLDRVFLGKDGQELMNEVIHSKNIVFMHIEPGKAEYYKSLVKNIPQMIVFTKSMEKKVFEK
jgi:L-ascorbate metabolism protein UlaG (beta-lactamase superfamily)